MAALVSIEFHQQVGRAVANHEMTVKLRVGVHHHQQLHHALDFIQVAQLLFYGSQAVEHGEFGRLVSLLLSHVTPHFAWVQH